MGRPKLKNPRNISLNLRLTYEESKKIENLAELLKISKTETIIRAINLLWQNPKPKRFKNISGNSKKNDESVEVDD